MSDYIRNNRERALDWIERIQNPRGLFGEQRLEMLLAILDFPDSRIIDSLLAIYYSADFEASIAPNQEKLLHMIGYRVATRAAMDALEDITWYFEAKILLGETDEDH